MMRFGPVFDSFLVLDGRVTALEAHQRRFSEAVECCFGAGIAAEVPAAFAALRAAISSGARFPKIEADAHGVRWIDRPAPTRTETLTVRDEAVSDCRSFPQFKGPELQWLQAQTRSQLSAGLDAVLERDGYVTETTTAAILIRDGERILRPSGPALPSTTVEWFTSRICPVENVPIDWLTLRGAANEGRAFALNALHGPRLLLIHGAKPATPDFHDGLARATRWRTHWLEDGQMWQ